MKKVMVLLLAFVMVLGFVPNFALTAKAATTDELSALIAEAEALDETVYSESTWTALQNALAEAKAVAADPAAAPEAIDAAYAAVSAAKEALADVAQLKEFAEAFEAMADANLLSNYSAGSVAVLAALVDEAVILAEDPDATRAEVEALLIAIATANSELVDLSELKAMLAEVRMYMDEGLYMQYTQGSWDLLMDVYHEALLASENPDVTKAEIEAVRDELLATAAILEDCGDLEELEAALAALRDLDLDLYTEESLEDLEKAINNAAAILAARGNQDEIDEVLAALDEVLDSMVEKSEEKNPITGDYTSFALPTVLLAAAGAAFVLRRRFAE